jgi:hypothetical protein
MAEANKVIDKILYIREKHGYAKVLWNNLLFLIT